ncbi:hypothetical protein Talka_02031 [Tepidimonas alkaliphilus]|uniref:Quercetin 2,3-dioxygenase C-terminal cupin domain-containing protein n=1 Tax=Tepidimonas alkaliphilus TaxID=2588942 RepID=A0A554W4N9_9BURK|nr:hypothetical protein [Tepidimonas alkaliphilus]TSE18534.1 hypothetical protein Talka_02031 [Tepidimonas alkaliphilus]
MVTLTRHPPMITVRPAHERGYADATLLPVRLDSAQWAERTLAPGRLACAHVARGRFTVNDVALGPGDAALVHDGSRLALADGFDAEALAFDLAP